MRLAGRTAGPASMTCAHPDVQRSVIRLWRGLMMSFLWNWNCWSLCSLIAPQEVLNRSQDSSWSIWVLRDAVFAENRQKDGRKENAFWLVGTGAARMHRREDSEIVPE